MDLTKTEFCKFNLRSKIQLLSKNGQFIAERMVYHKYEVNLYVIYGFLVEMIVEVNMDKIVSINPVINKRIVDMYQ